MRLDRVFLRFLKIVFTLENPKKKEKKLFRISYSCQMIFSVLHYKTTLVYKRIYSELYFML